MRTQKQYTDTHWRVETHESEYSSIHNRHRIGKQDTMPERKACVNAGRGGCLPVRRATSEDSSFLTLHPGPRK